MPGKANAATAVEVLRHLDDCEVDAERPGDTDYKQFLAAIAKAYGVSDVEKLRGRVFVAYISSVDLAAQPQFFVFSEPRERHSAASTVKVVLLAALIRAVEYKQRQWGEQVDGLALSDHAKRMIRTSNNESANVILDLFGIDNINDWLARLGFASGEIEFQRRFSATAKPGPPDNYATVAGLAKFWFLVAQQQGLSDCLSPTGSEKARSLLSDQGKVNTDAHYNDRLNGSFPPGVEFAHKTGSNAAVIGDGGIVFDGGAGFIIVAFDTKQDRAAMARLGLGLLQLHRNAK